MIENKRQLCFSTISLLSSNPKTVLSICESQKDTLVNLASTLLSHSGIKISKLSLDFPMQCTLLEVLYRVFLIARSLSHTSLIKLLQENIPLDVLIDKHNE